MARRVPAVFAMAWVVGCGDPMPAIDAPPVNPPADAAPPDAMPPPPVDAPPLGDVVDVTSASGRATGGGMTLDFQLGHSMDQGRAGAGALQLEGGAAITP
jgi:hypothetical protein